MTPPQVKTAISLKGHARAQYIEAATVLHCEGAKRLLTAVVNYDETNDFDHLWIDDQYEQLQ